MTRGTICMPIDKEKFEAGKLYNSVGDDIVSFLKDRKKKAFTSQEIMGGVHFHTSFSNPEIAKMSTFTIADFTALLYDLVRKEEIRMKVVKGRMFFMATEISGRCPKCGVKITDPKKTWKMTGRPDRKGLRTQLQIGLFRCSRHGHFRVALQKQKI